MPSRPSLPRQDTSASKALKQESFDPFWRICRIPTPLVWASLVVVFLARHQWALRWTLSGAPILGLLFLMGASHGRRVLPFLDTFTLFSAVHVVYALAATSWLFYYFYAVGCWSSIVLASLFQFDNVAHFARRNLRSVLGQLQFISDKIAFFEIPALEIDTEVSGLLVVRGLTVSLSKLTVEAHGVEVGIKLTDDMELAIQTEFVKIKLFRGIEVSDSFANLKGGIYEMTFGELDEVTEDSEGYPLMNSDTALLRAASGNGSIPEPEKVRMTDYMTDGAEMQEVSPQQTLEEIVPFSLVDDKADKRYHETMKEIKDTNEVSKIRKRLQKAGNHAYTGSDKKMRAAICSLLHDTPSVPHPPKNCVRVTTLQNMGPKWLKQFEHRLPFLLRLFLNPLAYFHPIKFSSITATASGAWIKNLLLDKLFGEYADSDRDLRNLRDRMQAWLADANFAIQLLDINALAQVPINTDYNIDALLGINDVIMHRTLPKHVSLHEVVRLGGADAHFSIPSFLLPHHEHILPPVPTNKDKSDIRKDIADADGRPQQIQAERDLAQAEKDETNVNMSVHARLPACLDQTLLDFIAAGVKASKIVEMEKNSEDVDFDIHNLKGFAKSLNSATRDGFKKAVVGGIANDKWIAKLVGKITKALETAQGDIGYSGNIPVALEPYRKRGEGEGTKLLP